DRRTTPANDGELEALHQPGIPPLGVDQAGRYTLGSGQFLLAHLPVGGTLARHNSRWRRQVLHTELHGADALDGAIRHLRLSMDLHAVPAHAGRHPSIAV